MSTPPLPAALPTTISPGFGISTAVAGALGGYLVSRYLMGCGCKKGPGNAMSVGKDSPTVVNPSIGKDRPTVVDNFDMEDIGNKAAYCRCWRSQNFPYCDGAHIKHNRQTGDNVGPVVIIKKKST